MVLYIYRYVSVGFEDFYQLSTGIYVLLNNHLPRAILLFDNSLVFLHFVI